VPSNPVSYAGGRVSSWYSHPCQAGQRVGADKLVPGHPGWGVGRRAKYLTPENFTVAKQWRRPRPTQGCSTSKEEGLPVYIVILTFLKYY
jgi:hypothetical protein